MEEDRLGVQGQEDCEIEVSMDILREELREDDFLGYELQTPDAHTSLSYFF